jgi:hypothetical protein
MTRRTYGILAGVIGSALSAWWYTRRRAGHGRHTVDRGSVIFDNTRTATSLSTEGIV